MPDILNNTNIKGNLDVTGALTLGTPLAVAEGGTGANNAPDARTNLGLTGDFATQYLLLAGRAGGQTAIGGTAAIDFLRLQSTSNATKFRVYFGATNDVYYDEVNRKLIFGGGFPAGVGMDLMFDASGVFLKMTGRNLVNAAGYFSMEWDTHRLNSGEAISASWVAWSMRVGAVPFAVKGFAAQTANLFDARNSADTVLSYINAAGNFGVRMGASAATAYLHIAAGTAAASTAPLKLTSGTNNTTAETGAMEYDGTNLFFTRTGTTRETVFAGVSGAAAPATTAGVVIVNHYGTSATNFLGDPNSWASVVIGGSTFKIPLYT